MKNDKELHFIKQRMKELGLNQRSLAIKAGCKPDVVRNRLSGKSTHWRQDTHEAIMRVLGEPNFYTADEELMQKAAAAVQKAAESENINLPLQRAMTITLDLYNHVLRYRKKGEDIQPNEALASLMIKRSA